LAVWERRPDQSRDRIDQAAKIAVHCRSLRANPVGRGCGTGGLEVDETLVLIAARGRSLSGAMNPHARTVVLLPTCEGAPRRRQRPDGRPGRRTSALRVPSRP
jgi:hypothetical protein